MPNTRPPNPTEPRGFSLWRMDGAFLRITFAHSLEEAWRRWSRNHPTARPEKFYIQYGDITYKNLDGKGWVSAPVKRKSVTILAVEKDGYIYQTIPGAPIVFEGFGPNVLVCDDFGSLVEARNHLAITHFLGVPGYDES